MSIKNKAQATLEFTVTFVIMAILLLGLLNVWRLWVERIVQRQKQYSSGRITEENIKIQKQIGLGPKISPWPSTGETGIRPATPAPNKGGGRAPIVPGYQGSIEDSPQTVTGPNPGTN